MKLSDGLNFVYGTNFDVSNSNNGTGKTTLVIDALTFALYGQTIKHTNNCYLANRSIRTSLESYVKLYFKANNTFYLIKVTGKFNKKTEAIGVIGIELYLIDDDYSIVEDITKSTTLLTKNYIVNTILEGTTLDMFKTTIALTSSDFINLYEGISVETKRQFIEHAFGVEIINKLFNLVKTDLNEIKTNISVTKQFLINKSSDLTELDNQINLFNEKNKSKSDGLKNNIKTLKESAKEVYTELSELKKTISNSDSNTLNETKKQLDDSNNKLSALNRDLNKVSNNICINNEILTVKNNLHSDICNLTNNLCEKCAQIVKNYNNDSNILEEIENIKNELELSKSRKKELEDSINNETEQNKQLKNSLDYYTRQISLYKDLVNKYKNILDNIKTYKALYTESIQNNDSDNPYYDLKLKTEAEIETYKDKLNLLNIDYVNLGFFKEVCSENGVKRYILSSIFNVFNTKLQEYLNRLRLQFYCPFR